ncbi:hypothetical protein WH297_05935 [Ochrobactrum vermis]|uniref:Uncharacterized protein n=1 Tax=Ochrobactrum vermis TaxID=1827297 RepID=A0ABU8PCY3_9HYPH|nr:hypothetical protein [Ochrobactrum vermis]PQZ29772.1 hypothetical protein CQZ93_06065 [Ochrobactrum vermis]
MRRLADFGAASYKRNMISFSWWVAVLVIMSIYWPITVMVAAAIVMTAFMGTKSVGWRAAWTMLAILLVVPAIWFYSLA